MFGFAKDNVVVDAERTREDRVVAAALSAAFWMSNHWPVDVFVRSEVVW